MSSTEDTTLTFTAANFSGAYTGGTALVSITVATLPATGTLKLSGNNVAVNQVITAANLQYLTYLPAANENGAKTFTVTASDGTLSSAAATVTMTLAAVNDAPIFATLSAAPGGTQTIVDGYTIRTYNASGTFTPTGSGVVDVLVVAGGGGASFFSGGGGGGGFSTVTGYAVTSGSAITVTVGAGGASGTGAVDSSASRGRTGGNSVFGSITSLGGGGGASRQSGANGLAGVAGGSGGGASPADSSLQSGGAGTAGQGNNGGSQVLAGWGGGGGGGAGGAGASGTGNTGGNGGIGLQSSISGTATYYAGGGGGSSRNGNTFGTGGAGGGGNGTSTNNAAGSSGTPNTGGGGGGGGYSTGAGGAGGSGIVIVRYIGSTTSRSYTDTAASDTFTVRPDTLSATDVDADTILSYGITNGTVSSGVSTLVGTYGTLAVTVTSGAMTFTPNVAAINAIAANRIETYTVTVSDGTATTTASYTVNLTGVNDTPTVSAPTSFALTEDVLGNLTYTGTPFADVDSTNLTVTLTIGGSVGTITGNAGTGITVGGTATARTFAGTASALNTYFTTAGKITYQGALNSTANRTLTTQVSDGVLSANTTSAITLAAVNDAPTVSAPASFALTEDVAVNLTYAGTPLADVDSTNLTLTLTISDGTITGNTGTGITVGGTATARTFAGTGSALNTYFTTAGKITYLGALNNTTSRTLTTQVSDGSLTATTTSTLNFTAVNDAPTVSAPVSFALNQDVAGNLTYTGTPVADVDSTNLTVTLTISDGTITGNAGTGITVGGTATARTFAGTITDLNTYFTTAGKITYLGALNNTTSRTLTTQVSDGALNASTTSTITLAALNVAPTVSAPASFALTEDTLGNLTYTGTPLVDVDSTNLTVTLTISEGTITGNAGTGITVGGSATARTFAGTVSALNTYFTTAGKITYQGALNNTTSRTLTTQASDGSLTGTTTSTLNFTAVNDAPTVSAPVSFALTEDVAGNLAYTGTPLADVDSTNLTVTLTISDGTITGNTGTGITVGGTATARTFAGTITDLNTYFTTAGKITYLGTLNNTESRTLTTQVSDGALNTSTTSTISLTAVNDAPTVSAPASFALTEDEAGNLTYTGTPLADVDSTNLTVTLTISEGTIIGNAGTGITVGGSATARTFAGTGSALNTYFTTEGKITYQGALNNTTDRTLTTQVSDGDLNTSTTSTITLAALNDAPTVSAPTNFALTEDVAGNLTYTDTPLADVDSTNLTVTLTISDGTITGNAGTGITVDGTATARTFAGTVSDLNTYFTTAGKITYQGALNNTESRTLTTQVSDGSLTATTTSTLNFTAVNDAPTVFAPASFALTEDEAGNLTYTGTPLADVDSTNLTVTLTISDGTITSSAGTGIALGGTATSRTFAGTITDLNTYFTTEGKITYQGALNNTTDRTLTTQVSDGALNTSTTSTITLAALNDAPTVSSPASFALTEDEAGNLTYTDTPLADVDSTNLTVTLTISDGTITGNAGTGITIGGSDTARTFAGAITDLNTYFTTVGKITYLGALNNTESRTLTTQVSDGSLTGTTTSTLNFAAVNDAPTVSAPVSFLLTEDVPENLTYTGTPLADVDSTNLTATLTISEGTITGNAGTGITVGGTATARTFAGTVSDLNTYFTTAGKITYQGALNNTESRTLTTQVSDGSLTATTTSTLNFTAVSDAPTVSAPASFALTEDEVGNLTYTDTPLADVDSTNLTVTLTISDGTITGNAGAGITVGGTATARTFAGTITDLNTYFTTAGKITYQGALNNTESQTLTTQVSDGLLNATTTSTLNFTAVNDAPTVSAPTNFALTEDEAGNLTYADTPLADVDSTTLTVTLTISEGTITGNAGTGITVDGTATARTFAGTVSDLNTYFTTAGKITYQGALDNTTDRTLTTQVSDGLLNATTTSTLNFTAVNDAPTVSAPVSFALTEDEVGNLTYTGTPLADVDSTNLTVTLTISDGTITGNAGAGITVGGSAIARTFAGTVSDLNTYFTTAGKITYQGALNNTESQTLTTQVSDGALNTSTTSTITLPAVNDAPTVSAPASFALTEDEVGNLTYAGTPLADVDSTNLTVTLTISEGTITGNVGTGITVGGTATARTFAGTITDLNTYFTTAGKITYQGALNNTESRTLTTQVSDGSLTATTTSTLNFTAVNDAPTVSAPVSFALTEDEVENLAYTGTPLADVDSTNLTVTLTISEGTITGNAGTGITVGGTATARTFAGTVSDLNTYFTTAGKITYQGALNNTESRTLTTQVSDGALNTSTTSTISLTAVNDAPTVSAPTSFALTEDESGNLTYIGTPLADVDSTNLTVTLFISDGMITGNAGAGITVGGTATARTFAGTITDLNTYFTTAGKITYQGALNNTESRTLTTQVSDGSLTATTTSTLNFAAVNDAPTVSAPVSFALNQDVAGNLTYTGTPLADVDSTNLTVTLTISDGTITSNAGAGITVGGTATARTFAGTVSDLNAYFTTAGKITYQGAANNASNRTLTTEVSDGALAATVTSTINFTPAPVLSFSTPTTLSVSVGASLANAATSTLSGSSYGTISYTSSDISKAMIDDSSGMITGVAVGTVTITATQAASANNAVVMQAFTLRVTKGTPTITTPPSASQIAFGQTLSFSTLSRGVASVAGSFTFTAPSTAPLIGTTPQGVTFTPTDSTNFNTVTTTLSVTVVKATPTITLAPTASPIIYGQTLALSVLSGGTANVPGTFAYTTSNATPGSGSTTQDITFTPTDTANYNTTTGTVSLTVNKAVPWITWATPSAITYGTALSATQLNATSSLAAGSIVYSPASGTTPISGTQTLTATFTPTDTANYNTATGTVSLTVNKATPTITWATPSAITYGTALSATQLNATASAAGTITYSPASGATPSAGTQTLTATFTPTDTVNYNSATGTVSLTVNKATPTITWATPSTITYGTALSATQLNATASAAGTITYSPASGSVPSVGTQTLSASFTPTDSANYNSASASVSLNVIVAVPGAPTSISATTANGEATVTFTAPSNPGSSAITGYTIRATASDGSTVTVTATGSPAKVTGLNPGKSYRFTVTANNSAGSSDTSTTSDGLTISLVNQTITFATPADRTSNSGSFNLSATATSGLPVTFTVMSGPALLTAGNVLDLTGAAGTVKIRASQGGNTTYAAAPVVDASFNVTAGSAQVVLSSVVNPTTQKSEGTLGVVLAGGSRSGVLLMVASGNGPSGTAEFTLSAGGAFTASFESSATPSGLPLEPGVQAASITYTLTGTFINNVLTGSIQPLGYGFKAEAPVNPTASTTSVGLYTSAALSAESGTVYSLVGANNEVLVLVKTPTVTTGGLTTLKSDGSYTLATTTSSGSVTLNGGVNSTTTTTTATLTLPGNTKVDFSGLSTSTKRTDRLINLSSRAKVGTGESVLITGFVIGGTDSKKVLIRAAGPALASFGLASTLPNPTIKIYQGANLIAQNDDWSKDDAAEIARLGAFAFTVGSKDAALLATLAPGAYTSHISDPSGTGTGVALAEIYDASVNPNAESQRLVNISSRGRVTPDDGVLIGGFVVTGNSPKTLLIRGIGPALTSFGIAGALADPALTIYQDSKIIATNEGWANSAAITTAAIQTGAFTLPSGSKDAAVLITLNPGAYTAQLKSAKNASSGVALIEIYEVP